MKLRATTFETTRDEIFKNDRLKREASIATLTKIISSANTPFAMAVTGAYGSGKSTFVRMWRNYLSNNGVHSAYFNAWESDHHIDPIVPITASIAMSMKDDDGNKPVKKNVGLASAKKLAGHIAKKGIPIVAKYATGGAIDIKSEDFHKMISELTGKLADSAVDDYLKAHGEIKTFREALEKAVKHATIAAPEKPFVVFVDELDRCRPDYALKVFECIKHVYAVNQIVFVVSLDRVPLFSMLRSTYGSDLDCEAYFKRFIDLEFSLPTTSRHDFIQQLGRSLDIGELISRRTTSFQREWSQIVSTLETTDELFKFSLRDLEHIMARIGVILQLTSENQFIFPNALVYLVCVRQARPDIYSRLRSGANGIRSTMDELSKGDAGARFLGTEAALIIFGQLAALSTLEDQNQIETILNGVLAQNKERMRHIVRSQVAQVDSRTYPSLLNAVEISDSFR